MKKSFLIYCCFTLLLGGVNASLAQQSITVVPEKTTILLGEPLTISVSITGGQPYNAAVADSLGHFEVLEKLPAKNSENGGTVTSTAQYVITCFDSGVFRLPPIAVEGNPAVVSAGIDITVNTLPADAELKYGDIKQIIEPESPSQWPYGIGLLLLVLSSGYMIYRLNRNLHYAPVIEMPVEAPIPQSSILQQINQLQHQWEEKQISSLQLGNGLMDIFRKFLGGKGIASTTKTGEELIIATKNRYEHNTWTNIVQSVRLCNAMRFGKYNAETSEGLTAVNAFRTAISLPVSYGNFQPPVVNQAKENEKTMT